MSHSDRPQLQSALPFLRWPGGKRWLARLIAPRIREFIGVTEGKYFEPFLGGGAMFFAVAPRKAHLSDSNANLIRTFCLVRERYLEIQNMLRTMPVSAKNYYRLRAATEVEDLIDATRFIFLNRTCYGGIHRTNQRGQFNVPYGGGSRTPENLWKKGILQSAALLLQQSKARIECCDFALTMDRARRGDVIYCDPTYQNLIRTQFDRYSPEIFSWTDQERLADAALKAKRRGALVIISNGASKEIRNIFSTTEQIPLEKKKTIGRRPNSSKAHREMLYVYAPVRNLPFVTRKHVKTFQDRLGEELSMSAAAAARRRFSRSVDVDQRGVALSDR
jgi:DNA adenine methylase